MKKIQLIFTLILLVLVNQLSVAQEDSIALSLGSAGQEYGKALDIDSRGNAVVALLYENTIALNEQLSLSSTGLVDTAVVWVTPQGDIVQSVSLGGQFSLDVPHGVAVDSQDNVYVTGYVGNTNQPTPVQFGSVTQTTLGHFDIFLAKYDANGVYQWHIIIGNGQGATEERAWDIAVDNDDNVIIGGAFYGVMDVNPLGAPQNITSGADGASLFVAKYMPNGQNMWAQVIDGGLVDVFSEAYVALDTNTQNDVILAGNFRDRITINNQTHMSQGETDIFIAHYDTNGVPYLSYSIGGQARDIVSPGAMRVTTEGDTVLTGRIMGAVDFDPSDNVTMVQNMGGGGDAFVARYQNDNLQWAFNIASPMGLDGGHRVDFDSVGNVYVAGWFRGVANFEPNGATQIQSYGTDNAADTFLAKYTSDGEFQWVQQGGASVTGNTNLSIIAGMAIDSLDNIWVTGQYFGTNAQFSGITLNSIGRNDAMIIAYDVNGTVVRR